MEKETVKYPKDEVYSITRPDEILLSTKDALEKIMRISKKKNINVPKI